MDGSNAANGRERSALVIAILGLVLPATLVIVLSLCADWTAQDITSVVGVFTSFVGTLVGAFLGVHVGAAGRREAQEGQQRAEAIAQRALAALPPEEATRALNVQSGM